LLILLTITLVTGIFAANIPTAVFADSRTLRQDTKQAADCDTVGAASPVSDSCNQRSANSVNNGVPTAGTPGPLLINELCFGSGCSILPHSI
jgi:hypothetical protein